MRLDKLIEELQKYPPEADVLVWDGYLDKWSNEVEIVKYSDTEGKTELWMAAR
jgi:hypothetical protein